MAAMRRCKVVSLYCSRTSALAMLWWYCARQASKGTPNTSLHSRSLAAIPFSCPWEATSSIGCLSSTTASSSGGSICRSRADAFCTTPCGVYNSKGCASTSMAA